MFEVKDKIVTFPTLNRSELVELWRAETNNFSCKNLWQLILREKEKHLFFSSDSPNSSASASSR